MKQAVLIFVIIIFASCNTNNREPVRFMSDKNFVEFERQYSPDSSMIWMNYGTDLGGLGYAQAGYAILQLSDTSQNLREWTLSNGLKNLKWVNNKTISAQVDIIPSLREGKAVRIQDTIVNGITIRIYPYDYIEANYQMKIEHRETSPNRKYELIAYRYIHDTNNLNFIHISVIPVGEQIPKYGNYFIADMQSDYVFNGIWDKDNSLIFYSNDLYADLVQYYFVVHRPKIPYKIVNDNDNYKSKYRWTEKQ